MRAWPTMATMDNGLAKAAFPVVLALHFPSKQESLRTDNRVATLEAPRAEFQANWRQWLSWAKLDEKE